MALIAQALEDAKIAAERYTALLDKRFGVRRVIVFGSSRVIHRLHDYQPFYARPR
jgi:hypothetical protein